MPYFLVDRSVNSYLWIRVGSSYEYWILCYIGKRDILNLLYLFDIGTPLQRGFGCLGRRIGSVRLSYSSVCAVCSQKKRKERDRYYFVGPNKSHLEVEGERTILRI